MTLFNRIDSALLTQSAKNKLCICNISELDGFFHALACSPDVVRPSVWLPAIWGGADHSPQWADLRSAQHFMDDVISHYNDVMAVLKNDECAPVFLQIEKDNTVEVMAEDWCLGFKRGMKFMGESASLLTDNLYLIAPMMLFSSDELAPKLTQLPAAEIERYRDMIPLCVLEIRKLLGANFTARITTKAAPANQYAYNQEKSGKTDLCSCGSGKQYKKCCGLN